MPFQATCPDCSKRFRVPHDRKVWTCKACGGELELTPIDEEAASDTCEACGAALVDGEHFCPDCGAAHGGGEEHVARRDDRERRQANASLLSARKAFSHLRFYLGWVILLRVLGLVLLPLVLMVSDEPFGTSNTILLVAAAFELALLIVIFRGLERKPFLPALALAVMATLSLVILLVTSPGSVPETLVELAPTLLFTGFFWFVVKRAALIERIQREFPDLPLARAMRGEGDQSRRNKRARQGVTSTVKTVVGFFFVLAVVLFALRFVTAAPGIFGGMRSTKPAAVVPETPPDATVASFTKAWNARDFEAMASLGKSDMHAKWLRSFERLDERYGWGGAWPAATDSAFDVNGTSARVELETEAGVLPFTVKYTEAEAWRMTSISFKGVKDWKK